MGNHVDLYHQSEKQVAEGKCVTLHHFIMEDDYESQEGQIAFEHDPEIPVSNELIFLLAYTTGTGEMMMIAEENGFVRINGQDCNLDRGLLTELRVRYENQLNEPGLTEEDDDAPRELPDL